MRCEVTDDERTSHDGCRAEHLRIGTRFASEAKAYIRIYVESANWTELGRCETSLIVSHDMRRIEPRFDKNSSFDSSSIQERAVHYYLSLSSFSFGREISDIFDIFDEEIEYSLYIVYSGARARACIKV